MSAANPPAPAMTRRPRKAIDAEPASIPDASPIGRALLSLIGKVPSSREPVSSAPMDDARKAANAAAAKAALAAGALALPPGVVGWLTILPEMMGVWKIQRHHHADARHRVTRRDHQRLGGQMRGAAQYQRCQGKAQHWRFPESYLHRLKSPCVH